jgi:cholesterol oxidase
MANLSTPIGELRSQYGVVVVGSGYGGAIAAYRMAKKARTLGERDFSVCVLERGLEIRPGTYPSTFPAAVAQIQTDTRFGRIGRRTGLFDFRVNPDISVLVGCGLGGTSLINAGVMLEPSNDVFKDPRWPTSLPRHALAQEFSEVKTNLGAGPLPSSISVQKTTRLLEAAKMVDPAAAAHFKYPDIAVSFATGQNRFGVMQQTCVLCGDCLAGCNHSAKNTVLMNYLAGAAKSGAAIFCGIDVRRIEQHGNVWLLHLRLLDRASRTFGAPELTLSAGAVFLAAGTLGSTEILLRSERHGLRLSEALGKGFSGNGDAIAFAYNADEPVDGIGYGRHVPRDASVGPLITGMIDERGQKGHGVLIQEGAIPGALAPLLRIAAPFMARMTFVRGDVTFDIRFRHLWRELDSLIRGANHGALQRTQTFLAMARDTADGKMKLTRNRLGIVWPGARRKEVFGPVTHRFAALTRAMKGRYVINPFSSAAFGHRLMTVHPLGGCAMGDSAAKGVVNADGQVFNPAHGEPYPGLYVCDGSIVPLALGTNPALTIGALAERISQRAAAGIASLMPQGVARAQSPSRVNPAAAGIRYAERLTGSVFLSGAGGDTGRQNRLSMFLHISAENLRRLMNDAEHEARIVGVARIPGLVPGENHFTVSDGILNVLKNDDSRVNTKLLKYRLVLTSPSAERFVLEGEKRLNLETCRRRGTWRTVSSYSLTIKGEDGTPVAEGHARNTVPDAIRMLASMEIMYESRWMRRLVWKLRYWWYFTDAVIQARAWLLTRTPQTNPFTSLAMPPGSIVKDKAESRPRYWLTKYDRHPNTKPKGPVLLAPGFGMSTYAFTVGKPSTKDFLCGRGYDVWLLDYRASDRLDRSLDQFTIDDLVLRDFPDAIEQVYKESGSKVRVLAHCVASLVVLLALLREETSVRVSRCIETATLSQTFPFIDHPRINRLKARLHLATVLKWLGFRPVLTADYDMRTGWSGRVLDRLLRFYPTRERCTNGVCRRVLFMYGEVLRHDKLDSGTHDQMYEMFDRANLTALEHLSKMIVRRRAVDRKGGDTYVTPDNFGRVKIPITLIQGTKNRLFRPSGAEKTYEWLLKYGGCGHKNENARIFRLEWIDGYAHLDIFVGKDAPRETYKFLLNGLERPDLAPMYAPS